VNHLAKKKYFMMSLTEEEIKQLTQKYAETCAPKTWREHTLQNILRMLVQQDLEESDKPYDEEAAKYVRVWEQKGET
jgi:hypothetical protein